MNQIKPNQSLDQVHLLCENFISPVKCTELYHEYVSRLCETTGEMVQFFNKKILRNGKGRRD